MPWFSNGLKVRLRGGFVSKARPRLRNVSWTRGPPNRIKPAPETSDTVH